MWSGEKRSIKFKLSTDGGCHEAWFACPQIAVAGLTILRAGVIGEDFENLIYTHARHCTCLIVSSMSFVTHNEELHQLDRTVGVLFLGYVVTMALYGFNAYRTIYLLSLLCND